MPQWSDISNPGFRSCWRSLGQDFWPEPARDEQWAEFTRYVLERLENKGAEDTVVQRLFNVVNEQFDNSGSDPQVINLLSVEVFEQFAQQKDSLEFARQHTHEKARHQLELILAYTGAERPDLAIAPEAQETMDNIKKFNEGKWTPKPKEDK